MLVKVLKTFIIFIIPILLVSCFSSQKNNVIIVEKPINLQNKDDVRHFNNDKKTFDNSKSVTKNWQIPVEANISKAFSKKHKGLTFATSPAQKVRAVRDGKVVYSGDKMKSYGKMVIIKHSFGFYSSYTQNKTLMVADGDKVKKGQIIAITGDKPFYFEMKKFKAQINPLKYLE